MSINSIKIPVSFRCTNRKYKDLHEVAKMSGKTKSRIIEEGLDKQLRAERRRLRTG